MFSKRYGKNGMATAQDAEKTMGNPIQLRAVGARCGTLTAKARCHWRSTPAYNPPMPCHVPCFGVCSVASAHGTTLALSYLLVMALPWPSPVWGGDDVLEQTRTGVV
jgi:hypothetical protein